MMIKNDFLWKFKAATEARWGQNSIDPTLCGFQFQQGTRWNPGLSDEMIHEYECDLNVQFPHDFRAFLREMNGTDIETVNVYGYCGEPHHKSVGVYSYPRDIDIVKQMIEHIRGSRTEIVADLTELGFELPEKAGLVPIYGHRYVVCTSNLDSSVVLSIVVNDTDTVVCGNSLSEYLEKEFLANPIW